MKAIFPAVREWFVSKQEHLTAFAELDSRLEGWFKGELLMLLRELQRSGAVRSFDREQKAATGSGRVQIDFTVRIGNETHYCELKAACISQAAGTPRTLRFYLREDEVGLVRDFRKLQRLCEAGQKWVLAFVYPNPLHAWAEAIGALADDLGDWTCVTKPKDFPPHLFIALWQLDVEPGRATRAVRPSPATSDSKLTLRRKVGRP